MKPINLQRLLYSATLTILAVPIVWASFWYNKGAFSAWESAANQSALYLFPMMVIAYRACLPRVNHIAMGMFICVMVPLVALTYTERDGIGWLYSLLELTLIWSFGIYALVSISKSKKSQVKRSDLEV